jgi:putative transcriptional regulator
MRRTQEQRIAAAQEVADLLAEWRHKGGLSQSVAAQMLGVSLKTYQGWEQGRGMPYPQLLVLALRAFA